MKNPCRNCEYAHKHTKRNGKQTHDKCWRSDTCEIRKEYEETTLEPKRKYIEGEPIKSMEQFVNSKDTLFYWRGHPVHISVLKSLQYRVLEKTIEGNWLYLALPKRQIDSVNKRED